VTYGAVTRRNFQRRLDVANDVAEDVPDGGAKQGQNDDHDNGDQDEDQSVLYQSLAFLFRCEQHGVSPFQKMEYVGVRNCVLNNLPTS
jgi:hypothetical protein